MVEKQSVYTELKNILLTVAVALISALNLHILIIPAEFAPGGVDGITIMLQSITGISAGYFSLMINLPLLVVAWFLLKRRYVIYTVIYTLIFSVLLSVLENINFYQLNLPEEKLLIALFSGLFLGLRTGVMLKIGASTGGVDVVAGFISKYKPHINIENIITVICYATILISGFVYRNVLSVMLALVQMFVFNIAVETVLKDTRNAVEFKINTKYPEGLTDKIINNLKHGATVSECKGVFTGEKRYIITTIINIRQIPDMFEIVKFDDSAFVSYTEANGVKGNFRWHEHDEVK